MRQNSFNYNNLKTNLNLDSIFKKTLTIYIYMYNVYRKLNLGEEFL